MNHKTAYIFLFIAIIILVGCGESHNTNIDLAYQHVNSDPERSLTLLDKVNRKRLHKEEEARYALVYTIAQDKSGLDVDNDSLLSIAYTYYKNRPEDSLYAKCQYYTGKYYILNSNMEMASECFEKSIASANSTGDKYTEFLALEKLSKVKQSFDPQEAVRLAREAIRIYSTINNKPSVNAVYLRLQLSNALLVADSLDAAETECHPALQMAQELKDPYTLADACQDYSFLQLNRGDRPSALIYAKKSLEYGKPTNAKLLNLAWAYLDNDSVNACLRIVDTMKNCDSKEAYTRFYLKHACAIKNQDYDGTRQYADSAYSTIESLYIDELNKKDKYYKALSVAQYERGQSEKQAHMLIWIIAIVVIMSCIGLTLLSLAYYQYKEKVNIKRQKDEEEREMEIRMHTKELEHIELMHAEEQEHRQQMHEKEVRHKEIQLATLRNYILKKISISKKIETLRGNKENLVTLSEEDWEEIRIFIENTDSGFITRLRTQFPSLTEENIRFMMLIRLKMPSKAMAMIYNITDKAIRQNLFLYKAKVGISENKDMSLRDFIESF